MKGIIFDLDNTLVKTNLGYVRSVVISTLRSLGYDEEVTEEEYVKFWFRPSRNKIIREQWGVNPDDFWKAFRRCDLLEVRIKNTRTYDDIGVLSELDPKLKIGIVTSCTREIAYAEKKLVDPHRHIDCFIVANYFENLRDKPHPDGINRCLEVLEFKPDETMMVGDSSGDILAAQAADVLDVLVDRGTADLESCKPSIIIPSLYGVLNLM